jgi:hypothetical protein
MFEGASPAELDPEGVWEEPPKQVSNYSPVRDWGLWVVGLTVPVTFLVLWTLWHFFPGVWDWLQSPL